MSAAVITFPAKVTCPAALGVRREWTRVAKETGAISIATMFTDHFLPVVQASMDLLEAGEADFEARCKNMLEADCTALINKLCVEMTIVGRQMRLLSDGLDLARTRLRTAVARLADTPSPECAG